MVPPDSNSRHFSQTYNSRKLSKLFKSTTTKLEELSYYLGKFLGSEEHGGLGKIQKQMYVHVLTSYLMVAQFFLSSNQFGQGYMFCRTK